MPDLDILKPRSGLGGRRSTIEVANFRVDSAFPRSRQIGVTLAIQRFEPPRET